jgi:hypothetical protein
MTLKKQLTTALQAAQQCGVNKGVQLQAFIKGVEYARKHGDWRSVKDELPPNDDDVLVVDENHDCYINYFVDEDWINGDNQITHWMPLPELPKAEEQ